MSKTNTNNELKPEWIRVSKATELFGIGRSKLFVLIAQNKIKSASLAEGGQSRATRLISYDSLNDYLENLAVTQKGGEAC